MGLLYLYIFLTCFEPLGFQNVRLSNTLFYLLDFLYRYMQNVPYHNCIHNHLPEDEPSGSKYVEDIKIKN